MFTMNLRSKQSIIKYYKCKRVVKVIEGELSEFRKYRCLGIAEIIVKF